MFSTDELSLEWGKTGVLSLSQFYNIIKAGKLEEFANNISNKAKTMTSKKIDINEVDIDEVIKVLNLFFPYYQDQSNR